MLLVQNISLKRLNRKIFEDKSFSLNSGKVVIVKGKNGSGKTSFLKTILNILKPTSGSIYWKGKELDKNLYDYYNNITFISDRTSSLRQLSIYENIKIWKKIFLSNISDDQVRDILSILNLEFLSNSKVNTLSLGETKKLELVRLIIENKKIWVLDEPFSNLDKNSIDVMEQTFSDHCNKSGSILFSSHVDLKFQISEEINL